MQKFLKTGLNNFVTQSGGDAVIFDGTKIKLQRLNEKAEIKSINNILEILASIILMLNKDNRKFDFTVSSKIRRIHHWCND